MTNANFSPNRAWVGESTPSLSEELRCPNCGNEHHGLYEIDVYADGLVEGVPLRKVVHCGCFHQTERRGILHHFSDEVSPQFFRASGDCICTHCSKEYRRHPMAREYLDWNGDPYLNRLCSKELVKL